VTIMVILIAVGGLVVLFVLLDLADCWLARAGKRSVFHRRLTEDRLSYARERFGETAVETWHSPFKYTGGGPPGV